MRRILLFFAAAASWAAMAQESDEGLVRESGKNAWHFRIGPVLSPRVRVKVSGPKALPVAPRVGGTTSGEGGNMPADPSAGYADREYADGYVKPDEGTEDPDSMVSGLTWNWGANDLGRQFSNGRMEFRTEMSRWEESVSASSSRSGSRTDSDRDIMLGVEAMGGWTMLDDGIFDVSLDGGFRFYGSGDLKARTKYGTSVTTSRSEFRYVDSYDASGWTDSPSGSYEGTPGGPGRIIGAAPDRREEQMGATRRTETYYSNAGTKFNYRIWDLRLGPTVGWKAAERLTLRGGLYGLLGIVDAKLKTSVATQDGSYRARKSKCEAVFGMAAGLSAQVDLTDNVYLLGGVEYDWWQDSVRLDAGGSSARIKLSDMTLSLALGIDF